MERIEGQDRVLGLNFLSDIMSSSIGCVEM